MAGEWFASVPELARLACALEREADDVEIEAAVETLVLDRLELDRDFRLRMVGGLLAAFAADNGRMLNGMIEHIVREHRETVDLYRRQHR